MDQDVLFILIIVVTVVINIVKAIKKKEQAKNKPVPAPASGDKGDFEDFEDILRKVMEPSKRIVPYTPPQEESLETLDPMGGSLETIQEYEWKPPVYTTSSLGDDLLDLKPSVIAARDEEEHQRMEGKSKGTAKIWHPGEPIDFRTAILYQTILERPYA